MGEFGASFRVIIIVVIGGWFVYAVYRAVVYGPGLTAPGVLEDRWLTGMKLFVFPAAAGAWYWYARTIGSDPGVGVFWLLILVLSWQYSVLHLRTFIGSWEMRRTRWEIRMIWEVKPDSRAMEHLYVWGQTFLLLGNVWLFSLVVTNQTPVEYAFAGGVAFAWVMIGWCTMVIVGNVLKVAFSVPYLPSGARMGRVAMSLLLVKLFAASLLCSVLIYLGDGVWTGVFFVVAAVPFIWYILVGLGGRELDPAVAYPFRLAVWHALVAACVVLVLWEGTVHDQASHLLNRASNHAIKGDLAKAGDELDSAIRVMDRYQAVLGRWRVPGRLRVPERLLRIRADLISAEIAVARGDYAEALEQYLSAQAVSSQYGVDRMSLIDSMFKVSKVQMELGDYDAAGKSIQRALLLAAEHPNRPWYSYLALVQQTALGVASGDTVGASESGAQAQSLAKRMGVLDSSLDWYLGDAFLAAGHMRDALKRYEAALKTVVRGKSRYGEALSLLKIGTVCREMGRTDSAERKLNQAAEMASGLSALDIEWAALSEKGLLWEARGSDSRALSYYARSIELIETMRSMAQEESLRAGFLAKRMKPYERAVLLTARLGQDREAFDWAERAKARALLDLLGSRALEFREEDRALGDQERTLRWKISALMERVVEAETQHGKANSRDLAKWRRELEQARKEHDDVLARIQTTSPQLASLVTVSTSKVADVQAALRPDEALLDYFVTKDKVLLWVVTRSGFRCFDLQVTRDDLTDLVVRLRESIEAGRGYDVRAANQLYRLLLQPGAAYFGSKSHLIIAPHDMLYTLPFDALVIEPNRPTYVGDRWVVSEYESGSMLVLSRTRHVRLASAGALFAVGDPVFEKSDSRYTHGAGVLVASRTHERSVLTRRLTLDGSVEETGYRPWVALPATGPEVEMIGAMFRSSGGADVRTGMEASEAAVKQADHSRYRYEHYATHGALAGDVHNLKEPALVFSLPAENDASSEDGYLTMTEVFGLRLNADLVTLSACNTRMGEAIPGEGLIGLTRAFFYAGTPSVVASLWSVADESTQRLMVSFYRYLKEGRSKSESLALAKRELRRVPAYSNPRYWAAFVLVGEP